MAIDVTVLRVFTDPDGNFGNPLGVVDASQVQPSDRQRPGSPIGLQRNDIRRSSSRGSDHRARHHLHPQNRDSRSPGTRPSARRGGCASRVAPINTLQVPAGIVQVSYDERPHHHQRTDGVGSRVRHPRPRFARRPVGRRPRGFSRRRRALPVDVDRPVRRSTARAHVRLQSWCAAKTKRPARRRCGSPTTSAATSPSPRARDP